MSKKGARMTLSDATRLAVRLAESGNDELLRQLEANHKTPRACVTGPNLAPQAGKGAEIADKGFKARKLKKMSKAETLVAAMLDGQVKSGEIDSYQYEALKLKIGEDTCWYIVDFIAFRPDNQILAIEAKGGRIWEDSIVKYKTAKRQYPAITFQMWQWKGGELKRIL